MKKIISILTGIAVILAMMPSMAFATAYTGTVEGLPSGITVENGSTNDVNVTNTGTVSLNFSPANTSIGRYTDGWWVGFKITAPSGLNEEALKTVKYSNDGGNTYKAFWTYKDSTAEPHYMTFWVPITASTYVSFLQAEKTMNWNYKFKWNGEDGDVQNVRICIDPTKLTLKSETGEDLVALCGTRGYTSLEAAVNAAEAGDTIVLLSDTELNSQLNLNKAVTIDGNGKTITSNIDQATVAANAAAVLVTADATIKNVKIVGPNQNEGTTWKSGYITVKAYGGESVLENVELTRGSEAVQVSGAGTKVTLKGTQNYKGNTYNGIEVKDNGSLAVLEGVKFTTKTPDVIWIDKGGAGTITGAVENAGLEALASDKVAYYGYPTDYEITVEDIPSTIYAGEKATGGTATLSSEVGKTYRRVRFVVEVTSQPAGSTVQILASDKTGEYDMVKVGWGPSEGFPIGGKVNNVTPFTILADKAGEYTAKFKLVDLDNNSAVIAQGTQTITVVDRIVIGGGGGAVVPPAVEKPAVEAGEGADVVLSEDGTTASITVADGYELEDVVLNGVSLGKVTEVKNLKTGDKLVVTAAKKAVEEDIAASVKAASIRLNSKKGKGYVKLSWIVSGYEDLDGYDVYRGKSRTTLKRWGGNTKTVYRNAKGLKKGTTYYYKVRGYKIIDGKKVYTKWSNINYRKAI